MAFIPATSGTFPFLIDTLTLMFLLILMLLILRFLIIFLTLVSFFLLSLSLHLIVPVYLLLDDTFDLFEAILL